MKKWLSVVLTIAIVMSCVCTAGVASAIEGKGGLDNCEIFYIEDTESEMIDFGKNKSDVIRVENFDNIVCTDKTKLITSVEMLNVEFESSFKEALKENSRIFVLGDIDEEEVREYFGLPVKAAISQEKMVNNVAKGELDYAEIYGNDVEIVNVAEFPMLGQLVYKDGDDVNVTSVYVENLNDNELVADTIDYCFGYDYIGLSGSKNRAGDFSNSWSNVDISTNTYRHTRATISTSIGIDRNNGNPNYDGEYLFYVPYKVDVDIAAPYAIHNVKLDLSGNIASKVYDYGPKDVSCDANASISFQLPKAISVSFTPGTKVAISKVDGGIDSNNFAVEYQPKNFLAVDSYTSDRMQCEAHIQGYQTGSYFQAYGAFEVETYKGQQPAGGRPAYVDPIIIVNKPNDVAAGS